jgi:hypothetical protein
MVRQRHMQVVAAAVVAAVQQAAGAAAEEELCRVAAAEEAGVQLVKSSSSSSSSSGRVLHGMTSGIAAIAAVLVEQAVQLQGTLLHSQLQLQRHPAAGSRVHTARRPSSSSSSSSSWGSAQQGAACWLLVAQLQQRLVSILDVRNAGTVQSWRGIKLS